ncbi:hypothetical protein IWQ60_009362 [Tieghemiomyces parasiticus]|uniref:Uncharacterized protein n=1 Tax=Tieghemiomyces parasiticus TaxID=78921 RepID=A0A9W7ZN99_9FUNG|nr:hypothetical protein IWQ60_009362 [Tieghemiomyces parasiticus]
MDFTPLHRQSGGLVSFSPDGRYLASTIKDRLVIRDAESLEVRHTYTCTYVVQDVQWSPHSDYLLSVSYKQARVDVWSLHDDKWHAELDESFTGLSNARWARDGLHVLTVSEFQFRLNIWSMLTGEQLCVQYPKYKDKGEAQQVLATFGVDAIDCENLAWSPDGRYIAVWDTAVDYKVFVYNPLGVLKSTYQAYVDGLGIKSVRWDPFSQFLAIGSYDQQIRFLNTYNWTPFTTLKHPTNISNPDVRIYVEIDVSNEINETSHRFASKKLLRRFELRDKLLSVPTVVPDGTKPNPKLGVGFMEFDQSGHYLCTRNDNMPNSLWIWDMKELRLYAHITLIDPVRIVRWNPSYPGLLAFSSGVNCIYLWRPERGCEFYELPAANFNLAHFTWSPSGRALALWDKERCHLGHLAHLK